MSTSNTSSKKGAKKTAEGSKKGSKKKSKTKVQEKDPNGDELRVLRQACRQLASDILNEKKLLNDSQQQKERLEVFWSTAKEKRDELSSVLSQERKITAELADKQAFEIKLYQAKLKNMVREQRKSMTETRMEMEGAQTSVQQHHRYQLHEFRQGVRSGKVVRKERELKQTALLTHVKQVQERRITDLRLEFEQKADELKAAFDKKTKTILHESEERRREETQRLETRKAKHIALLISQHKKVLEDIKKYYKSITNANLELISSLKDDVSDLKRKEAGMAREVNEAKRLNRRLAQPLQEQQALREKLSEELQQYQADKEQLHATLQSLDSLQVNFDSLKWENEVLIQKKGLMDEELSELKYKLHTTAYDVQQKTGFKNLLLERKLETMTQDLEKTESALSEVIAATNLDPEATSQLTHTLEDVLLAKNKHIQTMQDRLIQLKQTYMSTIHLYEDKLRQHNIPVEELGFAPLAV